MSTDPRVPVPKTYKLFVGGAFVRSEGGLNLRQLDAAGNFVANYARASRKDLREAVHAARAAQAAWAARSAFNRGQILFRAAEMLEGRRASFEALLVELGGVAPEAARRELDVAVDRTFWYAGWSDKLDQVLGGANPVAAPFFDFTRAEPTGVVVALAPRGAPLLGLLSALLPIVVPGNSCVLLVDGDAPVVALELAEVLATSDLPGGVVNLLTGPADELVPPAAGHMDVDAFACFGGDATLRTSVQQAAAANVKRVALFDDPPGDGWETDDARSPYWIERFVEWKTTWHPIGT